MYLPEDAIRDRLEREGFGFSDYEMLAGYVYDIDVDKLVEHNWWRKAYLARYGRQSMLQWDNVPVAEMKQAIDAIERLMKRENELAQVAETDWT